MTKSERLLDQIHALLLARANEVELLDFKEAAAYLKVSRSYLYALTAHSIIAHSKPNGKRIYFTKADLNAWALGKRVITVQDVEAEVKFQGLINGKN